MKELFEAVRAEDLARVKDLVAADPSLAVFAASIMGDTEQLTELLAANRSLVGLLSSDGWTPLHLAAFFGKTDAARLLLSKGALVNARSTNPMQNMPLHAAAAGRHLEVARLLIEHGAPVNALQHGGWSPLHAAAQNGDIDLAKALIAAGADVNARAENNQMPLDLALTKGQQAMVDYLESNGPNSNVFFASSAPLREISSSGIPAVLKDSIQNVRYAALEQLANAATLEAVEAIRVDALGRKGKLAILSKELGKLPGDERGTQGQALNAAKQELESKIDARKAELENEALAKRLDAEWIDLTTPAPGIRPGHLHPVTQVQQELEQLFLSLGFAVVDGPEVETEHYNFDALNIPADHPARDMQDTFWLKDGRLLRTHTSPVQIRALEKLGPPLKMIAPGRVFRNEEVDPSHEHTFYQLEGMMVDRDVSVAHLIYFMKTLLSAIFHRNVTVRLRPGFFPFVEPGFELDIQCLICGGPGCPVCKQSGWVELLPCGLVHPAVLRAGGADPEVWSGFAFGLGLTRLAMMRYGIDDIRLLNSGDLRFLNQF